MGQKKFRIVNTAVATTAVWRDHLRCTAGAAGFIVLLPTAVGQAGNQIIVEKIDLAAGVITVDGAGAELIEGAATIGLAGQFQKVELISNGVSWDLSYDGRLVTRTYPNPATATAIPVVSNITTNIVTAAAETNTIAAPTYLGQRISMNMDTRAVGDRVVTAAVAINVAANTIMTFGAARDAIELVAVAVAGALVWEISFNNGVALS